ncbi:MAG: 3-keto-disaccharide hydrolase [Thalassotalea sp.]
MKKIIIISALTAIGSCNLVFANKQDNLPDPKLTEVWQDLKRVDTSSGVPSDAIVLFDGHNLSQWQHNDGSEVKWTVADNVMTVKPGSKGIRTKESFCDMQLHIEWRSPEKVAGRTGQSDGNSGVFIQGRYEVQVLNSFDNETYANGQAGSVYKQSIPLVNASKPRLTWQTYDIIYQAPTFDDKGSVQTKANVTVLHNGVLIQNATEIQGPTTYRGKPAYKAHGCAPIHLQDHGSLVSYRNIWARKL